MAVAVNKVASIRLTAQVLVLLEAGPAPSETTVRHSDSSLRKSRFPLRAKRSSGSLEIKSLRDSRA
jgi:hypothetical protein